MRIIIIEDETPALNRIKKLIQEVAPEVHIEGTADSIESAVSLINKTSHIDLALFDIELADGQSFEIFSKVHVPCPVIFTTAYDDFALKAFKHNSVDYLLKPINPEELKNAIEKFKSYHRTKADDNDRIGLLVEQLKQHVAQYKNRFLLKSGTRLVSVSVDDISYFIAADKVVTVMTKSQQRFIIDYSLDELESHVDPKLFFRLNRFILAQVQSIKSIHTYFNGKLKVEILPELNEEVIVSRERAPEFKRWLDQ